MFDFSKPVHAVSCTMGTWSLFLGESYLDVAFNIHPYLEPKLKISKTVHLFLLCILVSCCGVTFTFTRLFLPSF
jgi:hypothetical protein